MRAERCSTTALRLLYKGLNLTASESYDETWGWQAQVEDPSDHEHGPQGMEGRILYQGPSGIRLETWIDGFSKARGLT